MVAHKRIANNNMLLTFIDTDSAYEQFPKIIFEICLIALLTTNGKQIILFDFIYVFLVHF